MVRNQSQRSMKNTRRQRLHRPRRKSNHTTNEDRAPRKDRPIRLLFRLVYQQAESTAVFTNMRVQWAPQNSPRSQTGHNCSRVQPASEHNFTQIQPYSIGARCDFFFSPFLFFHKNSQARGGEAKGQGKAKHAHNRLFTTMLQTVTMFPGRSYSFRGPPQFETASIFWHHHSHSIGTCWYGQCFKVRPVYRQFESFANG